MKSSFFISALCILNSCAFAQATIRVMQYNLLYYGNTSAYCNDNNNNTSAKNGYLATITDYVKPDIFTVNEISPSDAYADKILDSALNINGTDYYQRTDVSGSYPIGNMLFYDSRKFGLISQHIITTNFRDIDVYKLYYQSPDAENQQDTAYLTCIVAHLKAGSDAPSALERAAMTDSVMHHIENTGVANNYLLMGDFNLYSSAEQAYQNLVNHPNTAIRFYDPVNKPGSWSNNSVFANYHTQSTHTADNGCASTGGLDDRFDFILASGSVMEGTRNIQYVSGSYSAVGQDGNHFNEAVNSGVNSSAPQEVIDALYNMSDHLPVTLDLEIDQTPVPVITDPSATICLVTVDQNTGKNMIIWNKTCGANITSYNIYKETATEVYDQISSVPFDSLSIYTDYSSTPKAHADRYKIAAVNAGGTISELSPYHETIHLQISQGVPATIINLDWDDYEEESGSFIVSKYYIYKGADPATLELLDTIPGTQTSYTEENVYDTYYYAIGMPKPGGCNADSVKGAGYEISRSNIENNINETLNNDATLSDLIVSGSTIQGFNPQITSYNVELPAAIIPSVVGIPNDPNASVFVSNATSIPGATNIVVTAEDGVTLKFYFVNFTVDNGVYKLSGEQMGLVIHPNPFRDKAVIEFENSRNEFEYLIIKDITGKEVIRIRDISSGKVEITRGKLMPGVYFVEVKGGNLRRRKFVLE